MRRSIALVFLVLALFGAARLVAPPTANADGGRIIIAVEGLRSSRGSVRGALFASSDGWTREGSQLATCTAQIESHRASCVIEDVPPGSYAFAFLHDEDDDGALDRDWIGLPQEGFGFSNDAAPVLGPPSFHSARFVHDGAETVLRVHARYGL